MKAPAPPAAPTPARLRAARWAGAGLMALGLLHLAAGAPDLLAALPGWSGGALWTTAHWAPVAGQPAALLASGLAFWTTLGSGAVPLILLGALLRWLARLGVAPPAGLAVGLALWGLAAAAVMLPSGFVLLPVLAAGLGWRR